MMTPKDPAPDAERLARARGAYRGLFALCGVVALAGLVPAWFLFGRPAVLLVTSRSWPAHSCTVRASDVGVHTVARDRQRRDDTNNLYGVDLLYSYAIDDRVYTAERYE